MPATFTVLVHFTQDINDPVKMDALSPDGTERVVETRHIDWADYAAHPLDLAVYKFIEDRWNGFGRTWGNAPHGSRLVYETNHAQGQNFVLMEVDYDSI